MFSEEQLNNFLNNFNDEQRNKMLRVYVDSYKKHINLCKEALSNNDDELLRTSAHDVKAISGYIGAAKLAELAATIENNVKQGNTNEAIESVDDMLSLMYEALKVLENKLQPLSS